MNDTAPVRVFLSHSSRDADVARVIAEEIEIEFDHRLKVFVSSRSDAIGSGKKWLDTILEHLNTAEVLIILITETSENSAWVGFEFGYFWQRTNHYKVHALKHPKARLPSPLDIIQAKDVTNLLEIRDFLCGIGEDLGKSVEGKADIARIAAAASAISVKPPERTLAHFVNLLEYSDWTRVLSPEGNEVFICNEDALFQVEIDHSREKPFQEEWIRDRFPDSEATKTPVSLKIAGTTIESLDFVGLDGSRYFVPLPEVIPNRIGRRRGFCWRLSSLRVKVANIIGEYYDSYPSLEALATHCNIEIITS